MSRWIGLSGERLGRPTEGATRGNVWRALGANIRPEGMKLHAVQATIVQKDYRLCKAGYRMTATDWQQLAEFLRRFTTACLSIRQLSFTGNGAAEIV
jgi:hypothetical protein